MPRAISRRPRRRCRLAPSTSRWNRLARRSDKPDGYAYEFRMVRTQEVGDTCLVSAPVEAAVYWREVVENRSWFQSCREHVVVLLLDNRSHVFGHHLVSIGTLNECMANPRDIFGPVLCAAAMKFILMHNHPSGLPDPSRADHEVTRRVKDGANLLCVEMTDHVIVGKGGRYFSFRESGLL